MPIPVINPASSVLALTSGQPYSIALTATEAPTSWVQESGTLPTGLTFSTSTGIISGTPDLESAGSVYKIVVHAVNASGDSLSVDVVMGVERAVFDIGGATEMDISLASGKVTVPASLETDEATGMTIVHAKSGDILAWSVGYMKNGVAQDISASNFEITVAEYEPDAKINITNGIWRATGQGVGTRYQVMVDLTNSLLTTTLSGYEGDKDTVVDMPCEISCEHIHSIDSSGGTAVAIKTSQNFLLRLHRELA